MFKHLAHTFFDRSLAPFLRYSHRSLRVTGEASITLLQELNNRAIRETADYVLAKMPQAIMCNTRKALWTYAFGKRTVAGWVAEFGVWKGESINHFAALTQDTIDGFDSFVGLREDWGGTSMLAGHFSTEGRMPSVPGNVQLHKGWFSDTVPKFLAAKPEPCSFLHIDCDTYETTRDLLGYLAPHIVPGTAILFDEYFGYRGWQQGEYLAWQEFTARNGIAYDYLGFSYEQAALKIINRP